MSVTYRYINFHADFRSRYYMFESDHSYVWNYIRFYVTCTFIEKCYHYFFGCYPGAIPFVLDDLVNIFSNEQPHLIHLRQHIFGQLWMTNDDRSAGRYYSRKKDSTSYPAYIFYMDNHTLILYFDLVACIIYCRELLFNIRVNFLFSGQIYFIKNKTTSKLMIFSIVYISILRITLF